MTSALRRGRTLNPVAVNKARQWRKKRLEELASRPILSLSFKERHELKNLGAQK
ncbi:hypothetical protein LCGC14_0541380 [marine sediment metagenome]|uniref:Uncharacterized protein n=1 Tax=marine sediment metagenome TaxID=412755 RepID=A0A0F9RXG2_9ZZZZ